MSQQRIHMDQLLMTEGYCCQYQGKPFTGIGLTYIEGRLIKETEYSDGFKQGWEKIWDFEEGVLIKKNYFYMNTLHGMMQKWYINGQRKSLEHLEHGIRIKCITWNQFGDVVEVFQLEKKDPSFEQLQLSKAIHEKESENIKNKCLLDTESKNLLLQVEKELNNIKAKKKLLL